MGRKIIAAVLIIIALLVTLTSQGCIHDHFAANATYHYYDDLSDSHRLNNKTASSRLLQSLIAAVDSTTTMNKYLLL